jgi:hypothetical protein
VFDSIPGCDPIAARGARGIPVPVKIPDLSEDDDGANFVRTILQR